MCTRHALAITLALAAAYVFAEWVIPWWDAPPPDDEPPTPPALNPDAMSSSTSLHTLSSLGEEDTDADTEPFVDVLSPPPTHVVSRRRSFRNHDLFAASHISFSELGSLVAPEHEQ